MAKTVLYTKIRDDLRRGRWGLEGRLPSSRQLAESYSCSVAVVQQAFKSLDESGLIFSCRGKGTFWANNSLKPNFRRNKILGLTYLSGCFRDELEEIKNDWLNAGWFIAGYNADQHLQNPMMERKFVLQARREHFAGVVLLATPLEPTNDTLFSSMRLEGMKIAHLVPFKDDMSQDAYFGVDYVSGGRLAVAEAAKNGYKRVVYWAEGDSPDRRMNQQGLREMSGALGIELLPDLDSERTWDQSEVESFLNGETSVEPPFMEELLALPEDTCICSQPPALLFQAGELLKRHGRLDRHIGLLALDDFNAKEVPNVSHIVFDHKAQLQAAFEYISNEQTNAMDVVQKLFQPTGVVGDTL